MKVKSLATAIVFALPLFAVGTLQAGTNCYKYQPGWHMVSKKCNISQARDWQQYNSGVYLQPVAKNFFIFR